MSFSDRPESKPPYSKREVKLKSLFYERLMSSKLFKQSISSPEFTCPRSHLCVNLVIFIFLAGGQTPSQFVDGLSICLSQLFGNVGQFCKLRLRVTFWQANRRSLGCRVGLGRWRGIFCCHRRLLLRLDWGNRDRGNCDWGNRDWGNLDVWDLATKEASSFSCQTEFNIKCWSNFLRAQTY